MIHQLSYMALSYRVLATQDRAGGGQGNAMDRYLRMEGMADPLTRQWVLGARGGKEDAPPSLLMMMMLLRVVVIESRQKGSMRCCLTGDELWRFCAPDSSLGFAALRPGGPRRLCIDGGLRATDPSERIEAVRRTGERNKGRPATIPPVKTASGRTDAV